jgi:hypothetical protein
VLANGLVGEQSFPGAVFLGQFLLVRDEIVNAGMAFLTEHETPLAHFSFAKATYESLFAMNASGDEMMLGQALGATA